jgi:hypothetical protein
MPAHVNHTQRTSLLRHAGTAAGPPPVTPLGRVPHLYCSSVKFLTHSALTRSSASLAAMCGYSCSRLKASAVASKGTYSTEPCSPAKRAL